MFLSSNEQWHKKCWGKGYQFGIYNFLCCKTAESLQKWKVHYINNVLLLFLGSLRWGEVFQDRLLELFYFRVRDRISKVPIKRFWKFLKGHPLRVHLCYKECCQRTVTPTSSATWLFGSTTVQFSHSLPWSLTCPLLAASIVPSSSLSFASDFILSMEKIWLQCSWSSGQTWPCCCFLHPRHSNSPSASIGMLRRRRSSWFCT